MKPTKTAKLRLTLDVEYVLNGTNLNYLETALHNLAEHAAGEGMLTDYSHAEVVDWKSRVSFNGYGKFTPEEEVA